jgi:hypothetical protein
MHSSSAEQVVRVHQACSSRRSIGGEQPVVAPQSYRYISSSSRSVHRFIGPLALTNSADSRVCVRR